MRNPHFFQKCCHFCWNQNKVSESNTCERNEGCATVFLKWTDLSKKLPMGSKIVKICRWSSIAGSGEQDIYEQNLLAWSALWTGVVASVFTHYTTKSENIKIQRLSMYNKCIFNHPLRLTHISSSEVTLLKTTTFFNEKLHPNYIFTI